MDKNYFRTLILNNKITGSDRKNEILLEPLAFPYSFNSEKLSYLKIAEQSVRQELCTSVSLFCLGGFCERTYSFYN